MFTKEAQELAEPCYETIKTLAERQEKKCPECKGKGKRSGFRDVGTTHDLYGSEYRAKKGTTEYFYKCTHCNGTGKIKGKWEWEPEVGEWIYEEYNDRLGLIYKISSETVCYWEYCKDQVMEIRTDKNNLIPLLHWEKIEEILEGMGYIFQSPRDWLGEHRLNERGNYELWISTASRSSHASAHKDFRTGYAEGKTRQEAVMRAVIELGKE